MYINIHRTCIEFIDVKEKPLESFKIHNPWLNTFVFNSKLYKTLL